MRPMRAASDIAAEPAPSREALRGVIGFAVRRLHGMFGAEWQQRFRDRGIAITPMQGGLLLLLGENPGIAHNALARLLSIEPPTLVQTLSPLLNAGYVQRYRAPHDGRAVALHLTRAGQAAMALVRDEIAAHEAAVLSALSPAERVQLLDLVTKALRADPRSTRG